MAAKKRVKPLPHDIHLPQSFLVACEIDTKKGQQSYLYWKYVAESIAYAFFENHDVAFFDFIGEAIERRKEAIREAHPEFLMNPDECYYLYTDEEMEYAEKLFVEVHEKLAKSKSK